MPATIADLHAAFRDIRSLDLCPFRLPHTALYDLASLPNIERLNTVIDVNDIKKFNFDRPLCLSFPSLVELGLETDSLHAASRLFQPMRFERLRYLTLTISATHETHDFESFCETLHTSLNRTEFASFSLKRTQDWSTITVPSGIQFTSKALAHLLPFTSMSFLELEEPLHSIVELDDHDLDAMSEAWPGLRVLCLSHQSYGVYDLDMPSITLSGLLRLVGSCKKLEKIQLCFDALDPPPLAQLEETVPASHVHTLDICTSPITASTDDVALILYLAFPSLHTLRCGWNSRGEWAVNPLDVTDQDMEVFIRWTRVRSFLMPNLRLGPWGKEHLKYEWDRAARTMHPI
ncbi:hypothetical protein D9615_008327 [Tricholomella constricta]|uniref:Uncharacterized protein n=1 Tax=Tricholomella constricta TaxID=117010 RepID=A0A8H5HD60_9AGAR|nr:hypothetical protein D9615_008327 [Tricholomella constricta]